MVDHPREAVAEARWRHRRVERRRARRARAELEAAYEDALRQVFLRTVDLSESGVFLACDDPPLAGSPARICLELPGQRALVRAAGRVARWQASAPRGFAVEFDEGSLTARNRAALRRFVFEGSSEG